MNGQEILAALNRIAAASSRTEKEEILSANVADEHFRKVLRYAYDPFMTFGLTPPNPIGGKTAAQLELDHFFWSVLDKLATRQLTGAAAMVYVQGLLQLDLHPDSAELAWRILSKDLRCGISDKTINKVSPGLIPVFSCMLAHPFEEKRITSWPVYVEPKLDGFRVIAIVNGDSVGFYSRSGKPLPAVDHLADDVLRLISNAWVAVQSPRPDMTERVRAGYWKLLGGDRGPSLALDAEVVSGSFAATASQVRRKDEAAKDAVLHVFDALPAALFTGNMTEFKLPFIARRRFLEFVVGTGDDANRRVRVTERYIAQSLDEVMGYYAAFRARDLEGAMVKPLDGVYAKKRSHAWMKLKAEETVDAPVVGVFEGTGKYAGQLGGLVINLNGVEVRVGSGFSDAQRAEFWAAAQDDLAKGAPDAEAVGGWQIFDRMIEVEYHEKTPDGALRHPRFVRFRDDLPNAKSA